jgi:hypothetical protein
MISTSQGRVMLLSFVISPWDIAARKTVLHELSVTPPLCLIPASDRLLEIILDMPSLFR